MRLAVRVMPLLQDFLAEAKIWQHMQLGQNLSSRARSCPTSEFLPATAVQQSPIGVCYGPSAKNGQPPNQRQKQRTGKKVMARQPEAQIPDAVRSTAQQHRASLLCIEPVAMGGTMHEVHAPAAAAWGVYK